MNYGMVIRGVMKMGIPWPPRSAVFLWQSPKCGHSEWHKIQRSLFTLQKKQHAPTQQSFRSFSGSTNVSHCAPRCVLGTGSVGWITACPLPLRRSQSYEGEDVILIHCCEVDTQQRIRITSSRQKDGAASRVPLNKGSLGVGKGK